MSDNNIDQVNIREIVWEEILRLVDSDQFDTKINEILKNTDIKIIGQKNPGHNVEDMYVSVLEFPNMIRKYVPKYLNQMTEMLLKNEDKKFDHLFEELSKTQVSMRSKVSALCALFENYKVHLLNTEEKVINAYEGDSIKNAIRSAFINAGLTPNKLKHLSVFAEWQTQNAPEQENKAEEEATDPTVKTKPHLQFYLQLLKKYKMLPSDREKFNKLLSEFAEVKKRGIKDIENALVADQKAIQNTESPSNGGDNGKKLDEQHEARQEKPNATTETIYCEDDEEEMKMKSNYDKGILKTNPALMSTRNIFQHIKYNSCIATLAFENMISLLQELEQRGMNTSFLSANEVSASVSYSVLNVPNKVE